MRLFLAFLVLGFLALPALAQDAAPKAAPACTPVATVYGKDICKADITISDAAKPNIDAYAEKNKQDPAATELNIQKANLFARMWETALIKKFGAPALDVSDKERDTYLKTFHGAMKEQYGFDKDLAALVKSQLEKYKYSADIRQKLNRLGAEKQKAVAMYDKRNAMPADMKAKIDTGEQKVSEAMIKGWKVKKLLYETYGGKLAFNGTEMEPVDAYKTFLGEVRKDTVIKDDKYKDVFDTMEKYLEKQHEYVPDGAKEIKDYFSAPGWIYRAGIGKEISERIKASILALPHDDGSAPAAKAAPAAPAATPETPKK